MMFAMVLTDCRDPFAGRKRGGGGLSDTSEDDGSHAFGRAEELGSVWTMYYYGVRSIFR